MKFPRWGIFALKLLATLAALVVLTRVVSPREMLERLHHINRIWLLIAIVSVAVEFAVSAWKTGWMINPKSIGFWFQLKLNCVKSLFNLVLPGGVGGEAMRFIYITRQISAPGRAAALIIVERLSGLWAQIMGSMITLLMLPWPELSVTLRVTVILMLLFLFYFGWPLLPFTFGLLAQILPKKWAEKLLGAYAQEQGAFIHGLRAWSHFDLQRMMLLAFACLNQISIMALVYTMAQATQSPIDWRWVSMVMLLASLSAVLPLTLGGLGIIEGGYGLGFHIAGLPAELGIGVSLVLRCIMVVPVLLGAVFFLRGFDPRRQKS